MKRNKKLFFSGMVLLALVLTAGTFAYTYPGASAATLTTTLVDDTFYTSVPSSNQPNWDTLLPSNVPNSQIILPNAAGDLTENDNSPCAGENWAKVDEVTPDDWSTYISNDSKWYHTDLYNLTDLPSTIPEDTKIKSVTVYFRFAGSTDTTGYARAEIKTSGVVIDGSEQSQYGTTFVTRSYQWTTNPATSKVWTVSDVNALQAGVSLRKEQGGISAACTQVYVAVNYEFVITEGDVPEGNLFDITPHPDYTGDLQVKVYLMNTAALLKAYKYLNMELWMAHSLEAPRYQILSLENGVAIFNINGGSSANYTVEIWGGSYRLISGDTSKWGQGWSISPELYCEVTQR